MKILILIKLSEPIPGDSFAPLSFGEGPGVRLNKDLMITED